MSPVASSTQRYRTASLWFELDSKSLAVNRQEADWNAVKRGTVQHEVFDGDKAIAIADNEGVTIKVNCRKDAAKIEEPVAYGIAVSPEVGEGVEIAIYDQIRARILSAIEIRAREGR